ncbi:hypothetical protein F5144DRAFT_592886 [Chaetomium tenue]|uniref:Uncharacterized protein n=1 Tax=Chaetomium tenue TaxID=1854479 RepID=A0ACB7P7I3_9PEZI|nr:hypothetical protein F5144DRAFT_592886 [Chaetomium globosum]
MVFSSPAWVPDIPWDIPDSIPLGQFSLAGLNDGSDSDVLLVDGLSGKSYSRADLHQRVECVAGGLAKEFGWSPDEGSPWDKVVAIYSLNTIDLFALSWAIHRLNGICLLLQPTSSVNEIVTHMRSAKCRAIFTCQTLIFASVEAATCLSIPQTKIFTLPLPDGFLRNPEPTGNFKSLEDLAAIGAQTGPPPPLVWEKGQAKDQVAYLCPTSGTSGRQLMLQSVQRYRIERLCLVRLTESVFTATLTGAHDTWAGSSGSLVPLTKARLVGPDGKDIESLNEAGEIFLSSPNLFRGYLGNEEATKESFDEGGWLRTGDVGMFKKSPNGAEHLFILDRIKEMIKVKGLQVAPIEIELVLREHPAVADVAVIGVRDESAGERAKAFVVRSQSGKDDQDEDDLMDMLDDYVQERLDETHWLHDRIVFVEALPKSASGKVLKRELRALPLVAVV